MTKHELKALAALACISTDFGTKQKDRISCKSTDPEKVAEKKRLAEEKRARKAMKKLKRSKVE